MPRFVRQLAAFLLLFAFWLIFSGHFDALHLALGIVCSALVAISSSDLMFAERPVALPPARVLAVVGRFVKYVPWLLWQIMLANLRVVYLVFRPSELRPQVVKLRAELPNDLARVMLGNSITLTPGTVTMDIEGDEYTVHAVSEHDADSVRDGAMARRVGAIFVE